MTILPDKIEAVSLLNSCDGSGGGANIIGRTFRFPNSK